MSQETKPQNIAERQRNSEAEAALEQMFGYFSREGQTRRIVSEFDAYRAAGRAA
ncbi:hypothetical protein [Paracoccus methylarcula]|uniref:hypothetical protein n=1 Tax=Paracoccus methylarcula TaxID=72022 RepID=UPI0014733DE0|nr:hypothetical protein [Paracoccus methylarcula]